MCKHFLRSQDISGSPSLTPRPPFDPELRYDVPFAPPSYGPWGDWKNFGTLPFAPGPSFLPWAWGHFILCTPLSWALLGCKWESSRSKPTAAKWRNLQLGSHRPEVLPLWLKARRWCTNQAMISNIGSPPKMCVCCCSLFLASFVLTDIKDCFQKLGRYWNISLNFNGTLFTPCIFPSLNSSLRWPEIILDIF